MSYLILPPCYFLKESMLAIKFLTLIIFFGIVNVSAQSSYIPVIDKEYLYLIDRMDIRKPLTFSFLPTNVKSYERKAVALMADSLLRDSSIRLSDAEKFDLQYIINDNSEWSSLDSNKSRRRILKYFYKNKSDFFAVDTKDFDLHINPVLYLSAGKDFETQGNTYINTRGIELRGMINRRIGFYTLITDNQALFPQYVRTYANFSNVLGVPGEGYTKPFKNSGAVDFVTARGYFTFNITKNIQFQFGHDKNFIGNGYRSLILSDFSSNYTFLKLNTHVWKINYLNIFAEMNADVYYQNALMPKKYFALHHLSCDITKNVTIGLFEAVVFGRKDTTKHGQFDFNYLNPIIFYRSIEQQLGSEDNALLGLDMKVNFLRHFSFYGQLVLDEFILKEIKAGKGSWDNKQSGQLGIKYIDVAGISTLDLQLETNIVRPYTYSHKDKYRNYTNYNQPLAHPMGANFAEYIAIMRYQPFKRMRVTGKAFYIKYGADTSYTSGPQDNLGSNISKSYEGVAAARPYGNKIGQGIPTRIMYLSFNISYQLKHNLFIDLTQILRTLDSGVASRNTNASLTSISLRWNIAQRLNEF